MRIDRQSALRETFCRSKGGLAIKPAVGIRREDKSIWERRVPLTPEDARDLQVSHDLDIIVQTSDIRVFTDQDYRNAKVTVSEDLSGASTTFAVKEIPVEAFERNKTYVFFAHVIKGQPYNMPMLKRMMDLGCNLIDYEKVTDRGGRRLIFFGRHAGLAGMLDTLWAFGERLALEGTTTPFAQIQQAYHYQNLDQAAATLKQVKAQIEREGLPEDVSPLILGIAGYGNVSVGAQEMLAELPIEEISPPEIAAVEANRGVSRHVLYKAVFKEEHIVEPVVPGESFELQNYYEHPEGYRSKFETYLPHLSILVNAIYWDAKYPRLVTKEYVKAAYGPHQRPRLKVIGDISCDVEGAIEVTIKATEPDQPVFVYDPETGKAMPGFKGRGPVIMAVDILPSEVPREASVDFSRVLKPYVPAIVRADFSVPFDQVNLPPEIKRAVILHRGRLTPAYEYLRKFVTQPTHDPRQGGKT